MGLFGKIFRNTIQEIKIGAATNRSSEIDQIGDVVVNHIRAAIDVVGTITQLASEYPEPPGIVQVFDERAQQTRILRDQLDFQELKKRTLITGRTIITPDGILKER